MSTTLAPSRPSALGVSDGEGMWTPEVLIWIPKMDGLENVSPFFKYGHIMIYSLGIYVFRGDTCKGWSACFFGGCVFCFTFSAWKAQTLGHFNYIEDTQFETKDLFLRGVKSMRHAMLEWRTTWPVDDDLYRTDWFHPDESVALGMKTRILETLSVYINFFSL